MPREASDLLHGTLDVLVLKTLSWGAMHGYAIVEWIEQRGSGDLVIVHSTPGIARLVEISGLGGQLRLED